jgi:CTP:molybdopterin cytidylyltransferase MocA
MVEASFDLISACCESMFVVLDHDEQSIISALGDRPFTKVQGDADAPMFDSVRVGLQAIRAEHRKRSVLLHPADHPAVNPETVRCIVAEAALHSRHAIVPRCGERGGHPVLIPANLHTRIVDSSGEMGLRGFWSANPDGFRPLAIDDHAMTRDIDTQEHYDLFGDQQSP